MFNVSALLLDDALKPSTPLTNTYIHTKIYNAQHSQAYSSNQRRGMWTNDAINENQLIFDEVKAYKNYAKFLGHRDIIPASGCDSYDTLKVWWDI